MTFFRSIFEYIASRKWLKISIIMVVFLVLLGLVAWNRFDTWYQTSLEPIAQYGDDKIFEVSSGQTADEIALNLQDVGLISSSRAFLIYLDREGLRASLQAGTYRLNPAMSSQVIADIIANGKVDTRLLTILPGLRLAEVEEVLIESGFEASEVKNALNDQYDHPLLFDKPKNATIEGYIYPESFQYDSSSNVKDIITKSFDVFWSKIDNKLIADIQEQGLSFHDSIILSSIIANESSDKEVQEKIARVFLNRLDQGIELGSDPTFFYAADELGVEPSVDIDSPYNTRIYQGLPPGPISNFQIDALLSLANPASGEWLFFVSGDDGITRFSNTLEEHEALTEKYCIDLCRL